ncbi:MAG: thiamine diphosphokinase [Faecalibacterium sp.]|nr:thiamine diphosphokinase [Faecalibacterium sp.]
MSRCIIVSAGSFAPQMKQALLPGDTIIACDAGYRHCQAMGVQPHIVLGDFDSAPPPPRDDLVVLPHVKDDTDTHYAARLAVQQGFTEVLLLGALGGRRIEHTLANLATALWLAKQGVQVTLQDENSRISYVCPGSPRQYKKERYLYLSVFPAEGLATGVCIQGAYYPLQNAKLSGEYPLGVSNEFAPGCDAVTISTESGILQVIETIAD